MPILKSLKKKLTHLIHRDHREHHDEERHVPTIEEAPRRKAAAPEHPVKRETDIPLDLVSRTYTPTQTSLKAPFRADGNDHQRDQEYSRGVLENERFSDEDRFTNKSGDPRIGTHGRSYEPAESRNVK